MGVEGGVSLTPAFSRWERGLDSRFRGNDERLGAIHRAPTQKTYSCEGGGRHRLICSRRSQTATSAPSRPGW